MTHLPGFVSRRNFLKVAGAGSFAFATTPVLAAPPVQPIKIGFGMSLTGPNAPAGKMFLLAREIWKDEANAKGGLLGRPVQFVYYDDQSNPSFVPGIYSKLIDVDKVDLVMSAYGTNQIAPAMPIVMQKKKVFMSLLGTGVNDHFKYDRYFQILPNGPEGIRAFSRGFLEAALTMQPKPQTIAIVGEDTEFGQNVLSGARTNIAKLGFKVVYDRTFPPGTSDHAPIIRAVQATAADVVFVASYPAGSIGMVRAIHEVGYAPRMLGGAMIGLQLTPIKAQLGPLLNGLVINENYVPEPTMKFPGIDAFLAKYQERAHGAGVDPIGFWSPFGYAELQVLSQAVTSVGSIDQSKVAAYMHKTLFKTVLGDIKFGPLGEWEKSRILFIQYQNIQGHEIDQFRQAGKAVILSPREFKSGELIYPYAKARGQ